MKPYIIEMRCSSPKKQYSGGHVTVCAIAPTPEAAEIMARDLVISHGHLVESVLAVVLKSALPTDDQDAEADNLLLDKALRRNPQAAALFSWFEADADKGYRSLGEPPKGGRH